MAVEEDRRNATAEKSQGSKAGIALALVGVYLIWGSTYLAMRLALAGFPPFLLGGLRFLLAGGILFGVCTLRGAVPPTRAQWRGAAITGALLLGGGNGGVVFGEQWVSSGLAALIAATVPLWTALLMGLGGQWPSRREWLGIGVGLAGIVILNRDGGLHANLLGTLSVFLAALCWSVGTVASRRVALPEGAMASAAQMLTGGAVMMVMGLLHQERLRVPPLGALGAFVYLVFGAIGGYTAYVYLIRHVRPAMATSYSYVNPIVAVFLGAWLAGEHVTRDAVKALVLILIGVGLTAMAKPKSQEA